MHCDLISLIYLFLNICYQGYDRRVINSLIQIYTYHNNLRSVVQYLINLSFGIVVCERSSMVSLYQVKHKVNCGTTMIAYIYQPRAGPM